jgi:tetratricopeptide (TPR) repeat protein
MIVLLDGTGIKISLSKILTMKANIFLVGLVVILFFGEANAQWNWPEDKAKAETKNALYTDNFKQGNFRKAADHLHWLLVNAPDLNKSIYINGVKIYDGLASEETDAAKKVIYQDSVLLLYDLRIKYFNEESSVLNRKAYDAYKYYSDDSKRYQELFRMFKSTFELNGNKVMDINLLPYMDIVRRYKVSGGSITDEEVLDIYEEIVEITNYKIEVVKKNTDRLKIVLDKVNELLVSTIDVDCNFVENTLGPKLKAEPDNPKLAKNIMRLAFAGKCMELEVFIDAAKVVQKQEPEYGLAKLIGQSAASKDDFATAIKYLEESIDLTDDNTKKADSYYSLAVIQANQDKKVSARDYARKAVAADPTKKEAYKVIGNLYFNSFKECSSGENPIHDKAVYIAAYEMFRRAGDSAGMGRAKAQFPTMEEIFTWNMQIDEEYRVGCWINETVTIQKR